jgi:hypothetical protein
MHEVISQKIFVSALEVNVNLFLYYLTTLSNCISYLYSVKLYDVYEWLIKQIWKAV